MQELRCASSSASIVLHIKCTKNLKTHMMLFTHVVYSSVSFIFSSPLNCENCAAVFQLAVFSSHGKNSLYSNLRSTLYVEWLLNLAIRKPFANIYLATRISSACMQLSFQYFFIHFVRVAHSPMFTQDAYNDKHL